MWWHYRRTPKRLLDLLAAAFLGIALFLPIFLLALYARARFHCRPRVGREGELFGEWTLGFGEGRCGRCCRRLGLEGYPRLWNILAGDLSFVGPRPLAADEPPPESAVQAARQVSRPGLYCLWWLRARSNMTFGTEWEADLEYTECCTCRRDVGILLRVALAALYGAPVTTSEPLVELLGIRINNTTMDEILAEVEARVAARDAARLFFVNADCLNVACRNREYAAALGRADAVLGDGIGVKLGSRLTGQSIRQNVNGTDLLPRLCERLGQAGGSLYLLGARPGVAEAVGAWVNERYPGVRLAGCRDGYFAPEENAAVVAVIRAARPDVLLVAFGAPRQELWLDQWSAELEVPVSFGVGGLFDFYSGRIRRAPLWMRETGLEWVYRLIQEPRRMWKRYLVGNVVFLYRVWRYGRNACSNK